MLDLTDLFSNPQMLLVIKYVLLIAEVIYAIFAYIVARQVTLMTETIQTDFTPLFKLLAYTHFYAVLGAIVLTLALL